MAFKEIAFLLTIFAFGENAKIKWQNCDQSAPIQIKEITLKSPYPIEIKPKGKISGRLQFHNAYAATAQSKFKAHVNIKKKVTFWLWSSWISIPCVQKLGSCTYDLSCSQIPGCPGKLGDQTLEKQFTIPENFKIPTGLSLLADGTYKVTVDVKEAGSNRRVVCGSGEGKIEF